MELIPHYSSAFLEQYSEWLYLAIIPITAALIGWLTNVVAIAMTFYPLQFTGLGQVGWQGIIPSQAVKMATISVDLMVGKLIDVREVFGKIEAAEITERIYDEITPILERALEEVLTEKVPLPWIFLDETWKKRFFRYAAQQILPTVEATVADIQAEIETLFDVKAMVIEQLSEDKALLNQIFLECGTREFRFLERSGLYFGFLFGLPQMVLWYYVQEFSFAWVLLPLGGLVVGYLTNWLALKMIFKPLRPVNFGFFQLQGLFLKRQNEVAVTYARLVSHRILTTKNIFNAILNGKNSDLLQQIIEKNVEKSVDNGAGFLRPFLQLIAGVGGYRAVQEAMAITVLTALPQILERTFDYCDTALNMEQTLRDKMTQLSPEAFEGFLHPVFEADELKLMLVGAWLGLCAGLLQVLFMV
jgi:uncharacterized membrane protein YheB (UPF0754 family)